MDEIEVYIERTSGTAQPRQSTPRSANPKILIGVVAVAVIGLVAWLGSTTPNQAAPVETTTTTEAFPSSTSTTQVAAPAQENPQPVALKSMPWNEWAADLNANPAPEMAALEGTVLLTSLDRRAALQVIQISSTGVQVDTPECAGEPVIQPQGEIGEYLVLEAASATCLSPRANPTTGAIIEGLPRNSYLLTASDTSGWFCTWREDAAELTRYSIDAGLRESYEVSGCPTSVMDDSILIYVGEANEDRSDTASYYWTKPGETIGAEPVIDGCEITGFGPDLLLCRTDSVVEVVSLVTGETLSTIPAEVMSADIFGSGPTSPAGRYMALVFFDRSTGGGGMDALRSATVVDINSGVATGLEWIAGGFIQLSWISDTQLAVLNQPKSACTECAWILTVVDVTDFSQLFQLILPASPPESWPRLLE